MGRSSFSVGALRVLDDFGLRDQGSRRILRHGKRGKTSGDPRRGKRGIGAGRAFDQDYVLGGRMKPIDFDDRDLAIVGIAVLAICALFVLKGESGTVISTGIAAMAGLAQGRKNGNGTQDKPSRVGGNEVT